MKNKLLLVFLIVTMLLCACSKEENKNVTDIGVNEENKNETNAGNGKENNNDPTPTIIVNYAGPEIVWYDLENADLETPATGVEKLINLDDFTIMENVGSRSHSATYNGVVGYDQNCFYNISFFHERAGFKLDFNTGILSEYCDIPDCRHANESENCKYKTDRNNKIHTSDGYYEIIEDTLYYTQNGGEPEEIYKNEYYNEYGESASKYHKTDIRVIIKENIAYLYGYGWIQKLSLDTLEATEPIDIDAVESGYKDVVGDLLFWVNGDNELYCYDIITGEGLKLDDEAGELMCTKDYVYYTRTGEAANENGMYYRDIYRINIDGSGEAEKLVENTCFQFYADNSHIFYAIDGDGIYMSDADGQNPKKLDLSFSYKDGTEYKIENQSINGDFLFTSCESIDYLFILDNITLSNIMNENALFIVNKETGDVIPVSLGIFYQGDGYEGEYIDESGFTQYLQDSGHTLTY